MYLEIRSTLHTMKAGMATALSMWIAVLACVMGCTQPVLASSPAIVDASASQKNSAYLSHSGLMADMGNCHYSGGSSSVPPGDRKPASNGALSCCPLVPTVGGICFPCVRITIHRALSWGRRFSPDTSAQRCLLNETPLPANPPSTGSPSAPFSRKDRGTDSLQQCPAPPASPCSVSRAAVHRSPRNSARPAPSFPCPAPML